MLEEYNIVSSGHRIIYQDEKYAIDVFKIISNWQASRCVTHN